MHLLVAILVRIGLLAWRYCASCGEQDNC